MSDEVIVGLDIGGSSTKVVAVESDFRGTISYRTRVPTPRTEMLESLAAIVRTVSGGKPISRVGVTIPGIVDRGHVIACANIPQLVGTDFRTDFPYPAVVANDGVAAGLAEVLYGAGVRSPNTFTMMLGTGIAGAHFLDGKLISGAHAQAGEVGHIRIPTESRQCSCGAYGCLETVIGAPALVEEWSQSSGQSSLDALAAAVEVSDPVAVDILEAAAEGLAQGLLTLSALVDPDLVVIGGGVATCLPTLVDRAVDLAELHSTFHRLPEVVRAFFGPWAGAVGALIVDEPIHHAS